MLSTKPPGERTGHSRPGCYAQALKDCSKTIDREHYVSQKLLKRIGDLVTVAGLAWQKGEVHTLATKNLMTAKVLCKRHNNALSELDAHITDLYDVLLKWRDGQPVGEHHFNGIDIERWAVKLLLGYVMSGAAGLNGQRVRVRSVPLDYVRLLFGEDDFVPGAGLYVTRSELPNDDRQAKLAIATLQVPSGRREAGALVGIVIRMLDFTFITTVPRFPPRGTSVFRPSEVVLGDQGILRFTWPATKAPPRAVTLTK